MSSENLKAFYTELRTDPSMLEQLKGHSDTAEFIQKIVTIGSGKGFDFSADEVMHALDNPGEFIQDAFDGSDTELSDLELRAVSGGSLMSVLVSGIGDGTPIPNRK